MIVVPWSSSSEPLLYSAVAPARCTIRTKATTATFFSLLADSSIALSLAFIRHFPKDQSAIELELEVLTECYAQICVLRSALDGEFFFASGAGPLAAGLDKTFVDVG